MERMGTSVKVLRLYRSHGKQRDRMRQNHGKVWYIKKIIF